MEDQIISFETAKLAKEKRFNTPQAVIIHDVFKYTLIYDSSKEWSEEKQDYIEIPYYESQQYEDKHYKLNPNECFAPTQSLLQKWLREIYSIIVSVDIQDDRTYFISLTAISNSTGDNIWGNYKTYEEALESGLQAALKLITIK